MSGRVGAWEKCLFYYRIVHIIVSNVNSIFVREMILIHARGERSALGLAAHRCYVMWRPRVVRF